MLERRSFLAICGSIVTAGSFSEARSLLTEGGQVPSLPVNHEVELPALPEECVFRIAGWDSLENQESEADEDMWIHVSSSWRSAWR